MDRAEFIFCHSNAEKRSLAAKFLIALCFALVIALILLPNAVRAATPTQVYVGDIDVSTGYDTPQNLFDGKVTYSNGILTLDGVTVPSGRCSNIPGGILTSIYADDDLTIELIGVNTVTSPTSTSEADTQSIGVYISGDLTVSGSGSLTANGGASTEISGGVYAGGKITLNGTAVLTGNGNDTIFQSFGVMAMETIQLTGGGSLIGTCGDAVNHGFGVCSNGADILLYGGSLIGTCNGEAGESYGVCAYGNIALTGTATLSGTGGNSGDYSYGVYAYKNIGLSGSAGLNGKGNNATEDEERSVCSLGVYVHGVYGDSGEYLSDGNISVLNEATLTGTGGMASLESYGVFINGDYSVNNGGGEITLSGTAVLTATGGDASEGEETGTAFSYGLCSVPSDIIISGNATLNATGGSASMINGEKNNYIESYGVYTYHGNIELSNNATLNATGGSASSTDELNESYSSSYGIYSHYANIDIMNSASITATGGSASIVDESGDSNSNSYGIRDEYGNIELSDNASFTANGGSANYKSYGAYLHGNNVGGDLILNDSANFTANGGNVTSVVELDENYSYGAFLYSGDIEIADSASLTATGGNANYASYGVYLNGTGGSGKVTLTGGSLTATGGTASGASWLGEVSALPIQFYLTASLGMPEFDENLNSLSYGLYCFLLDISGGSLTGIGGSAYRSYGIDSSDITLTGGSLTGIAGSSYTDSIGVNAWTSNIGVSGGVFYAEGGEVTIDGGTSYGARFGNATITGGTVTAVSAEGGTAFSGGAVDVEPASGKTLITRKADTKPADWGTIDIYKTTINPATYALMADIDINQSRSIRISEVFEVSGIVTDGDGVAIEGALVKTGSKQCLTDEAGAYSFSLENGEHTITAEKTGYISGDAEITVAGEALTDIDIILTIAPAISGDTELSLVVGYSALSTAAYTVTGSPTPNVTLTCGQSLITYNETTGKIDIAEGLGIGTYEATLTAQNEVTPDAQLTFTLTVEPFIYELDGGGTHMKKTDKNSMEFTSNGEYDDFTGEIEVDGNAVPTNGFIPKPGSTIIDLLPEYLDTLTIGTHTLRVNFVNGYAEADFNVAENNPKTGENGGLVAIAVGLMVSAVGIALYMRRKRQAGA